jgi:hypothetical protein
MPTPLSDLQCRILQIALGTRRREYRSEDSPGADVYFFVVLAEHWGWKPIGAPLLERDRERGEINALISERRSSSVSR